MLAAQIAATRSGGVTGGEAAPDAQRASYLARVRDAASVPVCAGFGIREHRQVEALRGQVDGVIVGSALVEALERGDDPRRFLTDLKGASR